MVWALIKDNIVINLIVYQEGIEYDPGFQVAEIDNGYQIGDDITKDAPSRLSTAQGILAENLDLEGSTLT